MLSLDCLPFFIRTLLDKANFGAIMISWLPLSLIIRTPSHAQSSHDLKQDENKISIVFRLLFVIIHGKHPHFLTNILFSFSIRQKSAVKIL